MVSELLKERKQEYTIPQLSRQTGIDAERLKNIRYGKVRHVDDDEYSKILRALGADDDGLPQLVGKAMAKLMVVGSASAGPGSSDHPTEYPVYVPQSVVQPNSRGWVVEGDSMAPWLLPGDVVIATPHKVPRVGYPMLIRDSEGDVCVKLVELDGAQIVLTSLNPNYKPIPAQVEFIGFVTGRYRSVGGYELTESLTSGLRPNPW